MLHIIHTSLKKLHNPYFGQSELKHILNGSDNSVFGKVKRAVASGLFIRIRRGLYCLGESLRTEQPHPFVLAERIYGPSIISLESALSYHGLIPEAVRVVTSVTPQRRNYFKTPLGDYSYMKTPAKNFMQSVERIVENKNIYFMATPWRAIADYVYCYKKDWASLEPLVESMRIELEDLPKLTQVETEALIDYYHNQRINKFLTAIMRSQS